MRCHSGKIHIENPHSKLPNYMNVYIIICCIRQYCGIVEYKAHFAIVLDVL